MKGNMTKGKKIAIGIVAAAVIVAAGAGVYILSNPLKVKEDIKVEYGDALPKDAAYYLDKSVDKQVADKTKVSFNAKNEKDKKYPAIGDYDVTLTNGRRTKTVKVAVKDTTKPTISTKKIDTIQGVKLKWKKLIKAKDLQKVDIKFDDKGVKLNKVGKYTLKVTATDKSGNVLKQNIKVNVKAKPEGGGEVTTSVDPSTGNVVISQAAPAPSYTSGSSYSGSTGYSGGSSYSSSSNTGGSNSSNGVTYSGREYNIPSLGLEGYADWEVTEGMTEKPDWF